MYTYNVIQWTAFFFTYCFFGWIFESTYVSLKEKRFVNRGFLRLPLLPLYGTGAVMMLWVSLPVKDNLFLVYISGVIAATALEYVTGWAMERLFKMKYWDYSNQRFQFQGYICLSSSIAWGFLTLFLTEIVHNPIERMILSLNPVLEVLAVLVIGAAFITDSVQSVKEALDLGKVLESMTALRSELEDVQVQLALLKAEAARRTADIREEHAAELWELHMAAADLKEGAAELLQNAAELHQSASELRQDALAELNERLQALAERRKKLADRITRRQKSLLRIHPSASSRLFKAGLKELRDILDRK